MQTGKRQKLLLVFIVILVIITFLLTFIVTGCGRRARAIAALEKAGQSEEQNSQSQTETVSENEKSDTEETVKESTKDEKTTEAEESTSVEGSTENEDSDTSESEESVEDEETTETEESTEDEETTASESVEETTAEERTEYTADMPYIRAECTNIYGGEIRWDDVVIMPGDTGDDNLEARGFMSFDISQLLGTEIQSASISGTANDLQGTPVATYGPMVIKSVYWGPGAISVAEFDLNGTEITRISKTNFKKSPEVLKNNLQAAINHAYQRYQLCFYFEMSQTDGDDESDYIQYPLRDIILTVTYLN